MSRRARVVTASLVIVSVTALPADDGAELPPTVLPGGGVSSVDGAGGSAAAGNAGPATPPTTGAPDSFTLVATGDVLLHSPLWRQAEADAAARGAPGRDFAPLLSGLRPTVASADVAVCHMETPVAPPGGPFSGYPSFSVPPAIVPDLVETGYDACTTASNHTYDRGAAGVDRTLDAFDTAGLAHAGSARTSEEAEEVTLLPAGEATVGLLSYTYGFNGIPAPNGETWRSNPIDEGRILADAARARAAGADVVVVALHWGDEYAPEPNTRQTDLAPRLLASPDVDLLLGHHAHVVQPVEEIGGEWVVYGMGNSVANQSTLGAEKEEGLLVRFTFTETPAGWRTTAAEYATTLTWRGRDPRRVVEVGRALAAGATGAWRERLVAARDRTASAVGSRGALAAGLTPVTP